MQKEEDGSDPRFAFCVLFYLNLDCCNAMLVSAVHRFQFLRALKAVLVFKLSF